MNHAGRERSLLASQLLRSGVILFSDRITLFKVTQKEIAIGDQVSTKFFSNLEGFQAFFIDAFKRAAKENLVSYGDNPAVVYNDIAYISTI